MFPALFLDRDGVIIENRQDYVRCWEDVVFLPGALSALARLSRGVFKIVIITNQSAVGRGLIPLSKAQEINHRLLQTIGQNGGRIDGLYMCPHDPEDHCACRKPQPGLILRATKELSLDIAKSALIGDAWSDLQAGHAAGVPRLILVRTGRGEAQIGLTPPKELTTYQVCHDLNEALACLEYLSSSRVL